GRHPGAEDHELVAAVPENPTGVADHRDQTLGHRPHETVTDLVTVGVVDVLQAVEVDAEDGSLRAGDLRTGDVLLEPLSEKPSVGQTGEGVVQCEAYELSPGLDEVDVAATGEQRRGDGQDDHRAHQCFATGGAAGP